jgi:hypothetical protein
MLVFNNTKLKRKHFFHVVKTHFVVAGKHILDEAEKNFIAFYFFSQLYLVTFFCNQEQIAKVNRVEKDRLRIRVRIKAKRI